MMLINYFINNINEYYNLLPNHIIDNITKISLEDSNHINLFGQNQSLKEYYAYYIINNLTNTKLNIKDLRLYKTSIIHKNNNIEFNLHTNTAFIEFDLYNKVNYDKHIISKYLINIIKVRNYKYGRHIVLLRNFDKLTFNAFMTLRRMMELYSQNVLFITISTNLSKIPDSIKSRCFNIRCPIIEKKILTKFLKKFMKDINIDTYTTYDLNKLVTSCDLDFNKILLKLNNDNYFTITNNNKICNNTFMDDISEISNSMSIDNDPIKYVNMLENKIKKHLTYLKKTKNILSVISKNREFIYNITYFNYNNQEILEKFVTIILNKYSKHINYYNIIKITSETDVNMLKCNRDVFHYEKYLLNIYKLFHNHNIN